MRFSCVLPHLVRWSWVQRSSQGLKAVEPSLGCLRRLVAVLRAGLGRISPLQTAAKGDLTSKNGVGVRKMQQAT